MQAVGRVGHHVGGEAAGHQAGGKGEEHGQTGSIQREVTTSTGLLLGLNNCHLYTIIPKHYWILFFPPSVQQSYNSCTHEDSNKQQLYLRNPVNRASKFSMLNKIEHCSIAGAEKKTAISIHHSTFKAIFAQDSNEVTMTHKSVEQTQEENNFICVYTNRIMSKMWAKSDIVPQFRKLSG